MTDLEHACRNQSIDPERITDVTLRREDEQAHWEVWIRLRGESDLIEVYGVGTPDHRETLARTHTHTPTRL